MIKGIYCIHCCGVLFQDSQNVLACGNLPDSAMSAEDLEFMEEVRQELEQDPSDECLLKR